MNVKVPPIQSKENCPPGTNTKKQTNKKMFYSFPVYFFVMWPTEYAAIKYLSLNF